MHRIGGGMRAMRAALIVSALVVCGMAFTVFLELGGTPASPSSVPSAVASLLGNPFVTGASEWLLGGQLKAARQARWANPQAAAERDRSRLAYANLDSAQARRLLDRTFSGLVERPALGMPRLPQGAHIVGYPSAHAVQLTLPGHRLGVAESTRPLATSLSHGRYAPVDLTPTPTGSGFALARAAVPLQIPRRLSDGVRTADSGVTVTPLDSAGRASSGVGAVDRSVVVYANTQPATDTVVKPTPTGYQLDDVLRSAESPHSLRFEVSGPAGATLTQDARSGAVQVLLNGATLATILPPTANDAAGTTVPARMSLAGRTVTVEVASGGSYLYPIEVDPEVTDSQLAKTTAGKRSNWQFATSNGGRFVGNAVYEGPGKEHLETKGIAEYAATEYAFWAYETKGNSKIYEVKTKTSAKNAGAKIESFLEIEAPGGSEKAKKMLSNEFEEPEYSEKATTICGWNAAKVEECLPGAGKEKNAIRFQQSAAASPGSKFGFWDMMSEGIVSISEPAGTHSTTSYNTTEPEFLIEIEGKLQKRKNALYGSGSWLSKYEGALQAKAADPGIGVATTRFEYESAPSSWTELSRHEYLEKENACQGVQCYSSHSEYWTLDPKLPDGERKIRYRAEEAIAGTASLETEGQATVKVDSSAPHRLRLEGLPYGDELSERPYALTGEATDGEGTTVASSGVKSIALYIDGSQFGASGGGCSVAKGECTGSYKWTVNGAELGAGHHAIVLVVFDNAGNEARLERTISIRHSTPVALGPGSVDLQSGDYALSARDVSLGSGLGVSRTYSSRDLTQGRGGPLGLQWNISLAGVESLSEMVDGGVILTDANGKQSIFAPIGGGKYEPPYGDSSLTLTVEENEAKQKLSYTLTDSAKHTSVKFTQTAPGTAWLPTKQEGTVATDTVTYKYQGAEQYTEYAIGGSSDAEGIVAGPDGNIWYATGYRGVGKMTPYGVYTEYTFPTNSYPVDITVGPDNNLWVTEVMANKIAKVTTAGAITEYALPTNSKPEQIVTGADGNLWFTDYETNKIGKITTSGAITEYALPASSHPFAIGKGPDGNIWFSENGTGKIAKITTAGAITEYTMTGTESRSYGIVAGPDGNVWFTKYSLSAPKVVKMTTAGAMTEYALASGSTPRRIVVGSDKNLWTVSDGTNKIIKVTTAGVVKEYTVPTKYPWSIAAGPEGNLWYAEELNKIGVMPTSGVTVQPLEALAPKPTGVSCEPELKAGCRALKFKYATETTSTGENSSEWGQFRSRLSQVLLAAYDPVGKKMTETAVAEYSYDKLGRLRAEWDPRVSPALKTIYGYDQEGHVTALTPPGQESWTFTYGAIANDAGTGRLLKVNRAPVSEALWGGALPVKTEAPAISGSPVVGVRMAVSNGKWSNGPVSYAYQWQDCNSAGEACTAIAGANNQNYTPTIGDVGHKLVALVTATNGGGSVSAASVASAKVEVREFTEYPLPAGSRPFGITWGPDNNMWFTDTSSGKVGKISPTTGTITEYAAEKDEPEGIASGPDGNLWFVEHSIRHVNHITTSGALTVYTLTRTGTYNVGIVKGDDGNLWFTESSSKYVAKISTSNEIKGEYLLPATGSKPYGIALGPENYIWVADYGASKIDRITTTGTITEYALPAGSQPYDIIAGVDGNLWFTENGTSKVGRITPGGAITEYALPAGSAPRGIAAYGNLFVAEYGTNKVAQVSTSGTITEYALPAGSQPNDVWGGPDGNLWVTEYGTNKILRFNPNVNEAGIVEGEAKTPSAAFTMEYGVPLSGSGLPNMTTAEVAKWGQVDEPVEATAIMPPDAAQGWPATDYKRATIHYLDEQGREVNVSQPSTAPYGTVSTTEYNELNDVIRTLSPDNRQAALEAGAESADVAKKLSTYLTYRQECSKESENKHEPESPYLGARLCETEGPQHEVKYMVGKEQRESLARLHTKYFYDENSPGGETYNLLTKTTTLAALANEEEVEVRKTVKSYSGQSNLGWTLRAPTSITDDPEGKKITHTTLYSSTTGQVIENRGPSGGAGNSAHDVKIVHYTAEAGGEGYPACGSHPEWAGLVCDTLPAKQPETPGVPNLPTIVTTYNVFDQPATVTETFGSTVRTKTYTYDAAGRVTGSETTSSAGTALPKVTNEYSSTLGILEKQSTTVEAKTQTISSKYDTLGQLSEYTDADGNVAKYRYAGPANDWLLEEVADGSNAGTGKQIYTYNSTTKQLEELADSAAGTFTAAYDAEGRLTSEVYPNAMCANTAYDATGQPTHLEYIKTSNCSEKTAPVWFSETVSPSVRGELYARTSTLASETYAYDTVGRLTETQETPAGEGCSVRLYGYDEESNRVSQTTRTPGTGGACATEGGTVQTHSYDEGNRLTDSGVAYDSFGNVTKVPAADAEGHELTSTFYVDNAVSSQTQNGVTNSYNLDPAGRVRETVVGASGTVAHYDGPGEAVVWTSDSEGKSTRNIPGIGGALVATQTNSETPVLQLRDLQGNITATAELATTGTKLLTTYNSTEFGVPNGEKAPPKYAWLGAGDVASAFSSGVVTYGSTSYVPQIGRKLQGQEVEPPGIVGGSGAGAGYVAPLEPWVLQGAAAEAAEAPGLEAAREQAAMEAALAAANIEDPTALMNLKKAEAKAEALLKIATVAEILNFLDIPEDLTKLVEKYVLDSIGLDVALEWYHDAADKLMKCAHNNRTIQNLDGTYRLNLCLFKYSNVELSFLGIKIAFVYFRDEPDVYECAQQTSVIDGKKFINCPYEVHVYKFLE